MTLLAPGAMLLAAALAVPALAVFYLLKLRRRPVRVTSTLLWSQAQKDLEVNVPLRWIRPSWLLLLHALILAALLIAIGRPAIDDPGAGTGRVFLLIDRSASMSAPASPGTAETRLDRARAAARERVDRMADSAAPPEFTVVAFASEPIVMGPPSRDAATVRAMIDAISPTDEPGDPAAALELVRSLTTSSERPTESPAEDQNNDTDRDAPLALLITDGGELRGRPPSAGPTPTRLVTVGEPAPPNVGITAFSADREIDDPATVRLFLRALNTAKTEAAVPVVVRLDGEPVAREALTIPPGLPTRPGEQVASYRLTIPEGGTLAVTLERDDALPADNTARGILPPLRRPAVMLVVPDAIAASDPTNARDRADPLLLDVLEAIGPEALRVVSRRRYAANAESIARDYGLVIFDRVRPPDMPRVPTLSLGAPLPGTNPSFVDASEAGRTGVLAWDRDHPVMRDVVLDSVIIADRLRFPEDDAPETRDQAADTPTRTTLARGAGGPLIIALDDRGVRRVALSFALDQSNWPVDFSFPIFVLNAFDWLSPGADSAGWSRTGEPVTVDAPPGPRTLTIDGPAPRTITLPETHTGRVPLGGLPRVGLYTLDTGATRTTATSTASAPTQLAINLLDPGESALAVTTLETDESPTAARSGSHEGQRETWRWFVLAAGIGLLLEYLVYTLKSRA